jgi:predicted enzyme related to lactoylglutathione lyase
MTNRSVARSLKGSHDRRSRSPKTSKTAGGAVRSVTENQPSHEEVTMTGELTFFSLGVQDAERGRAFYSQLFGWRMEPGPSGQGYTIDAAGVPGGIHGGDAGASPYVFFGVDDIEAAVVRVGELGGSSRMSARARRERTTSARSPASAASSSAATTRARPSGCTSRLGRGRRRVV